jgi:beta-glucuronidase
MLFPRANEYREVVELGGFWDFRPDPDDKGIGSGWNAGFPGGAPIAVPASWNDQLPDLRDFL